MTRSRDTANLVDLANAKGDIYTATADNTPAVLTVGSDGSTLVADSAASQGLRWNAVPSASNPIINSAFDIWQRGTSMAGSPSNSTYSADRWGAYSSTCTYSRQSAGSTLPSIRYCMRVQRNVGDTNTGTLYLWYGAETSDSIPFAGKTVTFSFYARAGSNFSSPSNVLTVLLSTGTGTDQNWAGGFTGSSTVINPNFTLTTSWQRFTATGTFATSATQFGFQFQHNGTGTAGANDYYEVTGVQLDVGSTALPFRRAMNTLAGELAACERYYYRKTATGTYDVFGVGGYTWSTTQAIVSTTLPVNFRTSPQSLDISGMQLNTGSSSYTNITYTVGGNSTTGIVNATLNSGTWTSDKFIALQASNNASAYVGWSAEL